MDDFPGILARDFGFRPQGKAAPMSASKASSAAPSTGGGAENIGFGSGRSSGANGSSGKSRSGWNPNSASDPWLGDHGFGVSERQSSPDYDDVFGAPTRSSNISTHGRSASSSPPPAFDSIFHGYSKDVGPNPSSASSSSLPVYDKPVYDDDIFDGVPGVKSSSSFKYDDVFASLSSGSNHVSSPPYEDLLANLGKPVSESKGSSDRRSAEKKNQDLPGFDDLLPGFGESSLLKKREFPEANKQKPAVSSAKPSVNTIEDPFVVLQSDSPSTYPSSGTFVDPLEHINKPVNFESADADASTNVGNPHSNNTFNGVLESEPFFTTETNEFRRDKSPLKGVENRSSGNRQQSSQSPVDAFEDILPKVQAKRSSDSHGPHGMNDFHDSSDTIGRNISDDQSSKFNNQPDARNDVWLTVDEIPLFTEPTNAPPPSRKPPPLIIKQAPPSATGTRKDKESFHQSSHNFSYRSETTRNSVVSPIDELDDSVMGKPQIYPQDHSDIFAAEEEIETNSAAAASAAAMKEAMDRAEAKFRHAKEVRERERDSKFARSRDSVHKEDIEDNDARVMWEQEQKEQEYKEKEQKRLDKEREQQIERERERNRQAVERATREARSRAAAEARMKAERAAVDKANAEARQRAERAAVQRAAAEARERAEKEARERAAAEAREKAAAARERAAVEAREKAFAEAREKAAVERAASEARRRAERAAVERAAAEARERAATEARERAAAAREKQQKPENDLESFFGMSARANSAPKERSTSSETMFDAQAPNKGGFDGPRRTSGSNSTFKKASSTANFADDLASIFGGPPSSEEFQEIEGESEERRRARLERHQRTLERAAKALAEKNERDMQTQREQAERHRISETLDMEIKRWSSGKEGNLRALLSTLQYVLWPECGWQPVSLTDLITAAAVKKVYRKATLCIHPDKVQQKGATIQQKYIAEKVFDLLKEAWNKFNSEELF